MSVSMYRQRAAAALKQGVTDELQDLVARFDTLAADLDTLRIWGEPLTFDPSLARKVARIADALARSVPPSTAVVAATAPETVAEDVPPVASVEMGEESPHDRVADGRVSRRMLGKPVFDVLLDIMRSAPQRTWDVGDLMTELQDRGWVTSSNNPRNVVGNNAAKAASKYRDQIESLGRGRYRVRRELADTSVGETAPAVNHLTGSPEGAVM